MLASIIMDCLEIKIPEMYEKNSHIISNLIEHSLADSYSVLICRGVLPFKTV
jgi:hypothetical protein